MKRTTKLLLKIGLFALVLMVGSSTALLMGEQEGLALADLSDASVQTLASSANGNTLYVDLVGGTQADGLYRSIDNGRTWHIIGFGPQARVNVLATHPSNDSILYAGTRGDASTHHLWYSNDTGYTWQKFNMNLPSSPNGERVTINALTVNPNEAELLYIGTDGQGVYRYNPYGYELVGGLSLRHAHIKELVFDDESNLYAISNEGLFLSQDNNAWRELEVPDAPISLAIGDDALYVGTASSGVYKSTDGGETWKAHNQGLKLPPGTALRVTAITVDSDNPENLTIATAYGIGSHLAPATLYQSKDGARTWQEINDKAISLENLVTRLNVTDEVVHAATAEGLLSYGQSDSAPTSWTSLTHPSGVQALVLTLTLALASLVLVSQLEWLSRLDWRSLWHN